GAGLGHGDDCDSVADGERELPGVRVGVVALDFLPGAFGDGLEHRATAASALTANLADNLRRISAQAAAIDVLVVGSPDAKILLDHPVDQFVDGVVDRALGIADDFFLELTTDAVGVQEVEDATDADGLLEKLVTPGVHAVDDVLDA